MKYQVYAVKDTVQGELMNPFLLRNDEEAKRTFAQAVNTPGQHNIFVYYKDMQLFNLGEYESTTGEIKPNVKYVCSGLDVRESPKQEAKENEIQNS